MEKSRQIRSYTRSTADQLNAYLTFLETNPKFFRSNPYKKDTTYTYRKWNELAFLLNSIRGPSKKPKEWKVSLLHWKNQLKSRTRKLRTEQIETDDGSVSITLSPLEERALSLFGEISIESKESAGMDYDVSGSSSPVNKSAQPPSPTQSIKHEPDLEIVDSIDSEPVVVNNERERADSSSLETTYKSPRFDESRDEFDKRISEERLEIDRMNCDAINKMAKAVDKIADALLIFAQAYAKK